MVIFGLLQNRLRRHLSSMKKYLKSIRRNSAELGFVENCTIGFCCCQTKNERTSCKNNYFLQGKRSVEGDQVRAWACHRWNWKATQVFEILPKNGVLYSHSWKDQQWVRQEPGGADQHRPCQGRGGEQPWEGGREHQDLPAENAEDACQGEIAIFGKWSRFILFLCRWTNK